MWQLLTEKNNQRVYQDTATRTECILTKCYTDREKNTWWEFQDLATMPFTRDFAANKISSLFALGLTPEDIDQFFIQHKATLRSKDNGEKYEIAYSEIIEFEKKIKQATDPVKQMSSLVGVYFTINDEPIDSFSDTIQLKKMSLLESDPEMHAFFLQRQIMLIQKLKGGLK
jgi:hypothetical protein